MPDSAWAGTGEIADLIAARDWSDSPIGPPATWSISLRAAVDLMLRSDAQIALFWGPQLVSLYNDAYIAAIVDKHPRALGRPGCENWAEMWNELGPILENVRSTGQTYSAKDGEFLLERHGYIETVYFDVSYSAMRDDDGTFAGVFCIVSETTGRVLAGRRVAESESRLRALVTASADVIYRTDPDWRDMWMLDGRGPLIDTAPAQSDWMLKAIPPEDRAELRAHIEKAIAAVEPFHLEHRIQQLDGTIGWTLSRAVPILDDAGRITEWFGVASDITRRHRDQEHLELVIHELNHRVKNSLAMIQSIAAQTFRDATDMPQAQERFAGRLVALAHANDLLTGERWTGAALRGAVEKALAPLALGPDRIRIDGPDITVSPKTALALSLAIHELSTNAVKYGALSNDAGRIAIAWHSHLGDKGGQRLRIEWREHDGPPVREPSRRGFGSRLIERGLAGEMEGEVSLIFAPEGLRCTVDAPLAAGHED